MKRTVLLLLIISLLLSLAACGGSKEPAEDPQTESPAAEVVPSSPASGETPSEPAAEEPSSEPTADDPVSESPAASQTPATSQPTPQPAATSGALGMTAEAFVAAYNKTASDGGESNQITGFTLERAAQLSSGWLCVTATVEVGSDSKVAQVMNIYLDADGGLAGVELLITASAAASGSDLSEAPDNWESFKGTLSLIARVLGSKENKVKKQADSMDKSFSVESEGVTYDYAPIGGGICRLNVYSTAAGSVI